MRAVQSCPSLYDQDERDYTQMSLIVELARRVSSCGWVALCERRRAGFARLSGWQPVGNWVVSAANFPASLLPVGVIPTTSRRIATRDCKSHEAHSAGALRQKARDLGLPL